MVNPNTPTTNALFEAEWKTSPTKNTLGGSDGSLYSPIDINIKPKVYVDDTIKKNCKLYVHMGDKKFY